MGLKDTEICSIEGCDSSFYGHGYCHKHYQRLKRHGDPLVLRGKKRFLTIQDQFQSKYKIKDNGCWEWQGAKANHGYGVFRVTINGSNCLLRAHRFSYEQYIGKITSKMMVCHKCDNPCCVNPEHLFLGSAKDNSLDMAKKKRSTFGERNPQAKLTEKQVKQIKLMLKKGISSPIIAIKYGVTSGAIRSIATQRIWSHIECP
jgi:hypothetical protein